MWERLVCDVVVVVDGLCGGLQNPPMLYATPVPTRHWSLMHRIHLTLWFNSMKLEVFLGGQQQRRPIIWEGWLCGASPQNPPIWTVRRPEYNSTHRQSDYWKVTRYIDATHSLFAETTIMWRFQTHNPFLLHCSEYSVYNCRLGGANDTLRLWLSGP